MLRLTRRRLLLLGVGTAALSGCSLLSSLSGPSTSLYPEIQGAFAAAAVLLETGAAALASGAINKTGATVTAINDVIQTKIVPVFATAKSDVDSGATIAQALIDEITTGVNALAASIATAKPTAIQGAAMQARYEQRKRTGFVLTIAAAVTIVEELVSLAVQYGGPIASYISSLIGGISNSSSSTAATVDAAYLNFQAALADWNKALAA